MSSRRGRFVENKQSPGSHQRACDADELAVGERQRAGGSLDVEIAERRGRRALRAPSRPRAPDWRRRTTSSRPSITLSRIDISSRTSVSWKTVAMPVAWAALGEAEAHRSAVPFQGAALRANDVARRILMSVLLPEPFSPTSAWISPGRTRSEQESSASVSPKVRLRSRASRSGVRPSRCRHASVQHSRCCRPTSFICAGRRGSHGHIMPPARQ